MRLLVILLTCLTLSTSVHAEDSKTNIEQVKSDIRLMTAWQIARGQDIGFTQKAVMFDKAIRQYLISKDLIDKKEWKVD